MRLVFAALAALLFVMPASAVTYRFDSGPIQTTYSSTVEPGGVEREVIAPPPPVVSFSLEFSLPEVPDDGFYSLVSPGPFIFDPDLATDVSFSAVGFSLLRAGDEPRVSVGFTGGSIVDYTIEYYAGASGASDGFFLRWIKVGDFQDLRIIQNSEYICTERVEFGGLCTQGWFGTASGPGNWSSDVEVVPLPAPALMLLASLGLFGLRSRNRRWFDRSARRSAGNNHICLRIAEPRTGV